MCGILALVWPSSASAIDIDPIDYGHLNTLTLHVAYAGTDIEGMTYDIYYVATGNEGTSFTLAGAFAGYPVDLTDLTASGWQTAADQLAGYARTDHIAPNATGITDAAGNITFTGLPAGLYLSVGEDLIKGYSLFEVSPFLVALPHLQDDGSWLYVTFAALGGTVRYGWSGGRVMGTGVIGPLSDRDGSFAITPFKTMNPGALLAHATELCELTSGGRR